MACDEKTTLKIRQGDIAAFNLLFKSIYLQLYFHCRKFIPDPEEAKDLLQNVFLRFWEKREDIDIHTSIEAYLYRAVRNECLNHIRSSQIMHTLEDSSLEHNRDLSESDSPETGLEIQDIEQITEKTIDQLPAQCKTIFKLSRIEGLKNQEIADQLGISIRTVETQIYRALKLLKERLKDYLVPP